MLFLLLVACSATNASDTSAPICTRVHVQDTRTGGEYVAVCTKTGQPAYTCEDVDSCWLDAGGDAIFDYDCNRPADKDDAEQQLNDYCGGYTAVE